LNVEKLPRTCQFFQKKVTKIVIFQQNSRWHFVEKITIFVNSFEKNVKFLAMF